MSIRLLSFLVVYGLAVVSATADAPTPTRAAQLQPSAEVRRLSPIINQALGLARSETSLVAVEQAGAVNVTAEVLFAGQPEVLQLHPHSVRAPNYQVLVQQPDGSLQPTAPGPITSFRGTVAGIPDSAVAASLTQDGLRALVLIPGRPRVWIEPVPATVATATTSAHVVYTDADRLADGGRCGTWAPAGEAAADMQAGFDVVADASFGENDTRWTQLAIDTDANYYAFHGSVQAVEAEINEVISISNIQYERDVGIGHYIVTIMIRPSEPDPYSSSNPSNLLDQFRNQWFQFHSTIERDVAHLFTGRALSNDVSGIAYFSGICSDVEGYSLVSRAATFCSALACRTDLTSHELGHNWAASHCACPGWTMNPAIHSGNQFHPDFTIPQILAYRNTLGCLEVGDMLLGVAVESPGTTIAETNEVPLRALALFEFSYPQDVTPLVTWQVNPPTVGFVDADGVFTAAEVDGATNATITATYTFDSATRVGSANVTIVNAQPAPLPDSALPNKVRYVSVTPSTGAADSALRVRIVSLYAPNPPYPQSRSDLVGWEGSIYWIGEPQTCTDSTGGGTFRCAKLVCAPHYSSEWGSEAIHVTSPEIIPSSTYEVRSFPASCEGTEDECVLASAPLIVRTQRWGDIVAPFQIGSAGGHPNAIDIAAGVDKLRALPGSILNPRAQLRPAVLPPNSNISALDLGVLVDAVKGVGYPLPGPCSCPPFLNCPNVDDCGRCQAP